MNFPNCTITSTNDYYLQVKNPFDNKLNLNYCYKNKSDNNLPFIEYNLFNKSLFNGINQKSEISNSSISRRSLKIKNKIDKVGINPIQELNSENIDEIISRKSKIFEALEKLLINDNNKNDNNDNNDNDDNNMNNNYNHNHNHNKNNNPIINKSFIDKKKDSNNFLSLNKSQDNINNDDKKKDKKSLSSLCVPKLDLSDIVSEYETSPLYIQEVKYVSINRPKKKNKKKKKDKIDNNIETYS